MPSIGNGSQHRCLTLEEAHQSALAQIRRAFAKDVLPFVRGLSIHEITRIHLIEVIGRIEACKSLPARRKYERG